MTRVRAILLSTLGLLATPCVVLAQPQDTEYTIQSLSGDPKSFPIWDLKQGIVVATNGVLVKYGDAVVTADTLALHLATHEAIADGHVRIQQHDLLWTSEHVNYNFSTHQLEAQQFRTGKAPVFASGEGLHADTTNHVYIATNAVLTTEDISKPAIKVKAKRIVIIPGKRIDAHSAVVYWGDVPVFYFPFYTRNLGEHANNFNFVPGARTEFGPFLLSSYNWYYNDQLDGIFHLDYRQKRGPGVGPDFNYHLGPWGDGTLRYYYTHDDDPNQDHLGVPIQEDRQRVWFSYQANPETNLYLKTLVRYESDLAVVRDFFEGEYRHNPQPNTYFDANKFWSNFSLDAYVQPRVNPWLETVERLPDIRLTGYRQELGSSPIYYESDTSAGYYRRAFAENSGVYGAPPGLNYEAARADTFHQLMLPQTLFGWLNVTPRVGARLTYYSDASGPGATTDESYRGVFNTGAEVSFKTSRVWPGVQSQLMEMDGLRHILEPSANYVFVPHPSTPASQLPKFDYELPSLRLLPIEYPDYNSIDSIDSQNVIRWGLRNKLQTKREGQVVNLVNWDLYTDWRLDPHATQTTFADLYSDLGFRPRSWVSVESLVRYGINSGLLNMSYTTLTLSPGTTWRWTLGQYYLRDDVGTPSLGPGNNVFTSTFYYRLNENWGVRMAHYFEAKTGTLQEQSYTIYRDLRSWTAAVSLLIRDNPASGHMDYGAAFTFSLKAFPRYGRDLDVTAPYSLLGR
jgi:lipopolysaccharide assembly outer membrane protein LptD (OstA)